MVACEKYSSNLKTLNTVFTIFPIFQVVGTLLFHYFSIRKPHIYPLNFLSPIQLIKFHLLSVPKWFYTHNIFSIINQPQYLPLPKFVSLYYVKPLSNPPFFVKPFNFWFRLCFLWCFMTPGFCFLFGSNVFFDCFWWKQCRYPLNGSWMEWNNAFNTTM